MSIRKKALLKTLPIWLVCLTIFAEIWAAENLEPRAKVKEVSPGISVLRQGVAYPIYPWGVMLKVGDEVRTDDTGVLTIKFPQLSLESEITLYSSSALMLKGIEKEMNIIVHDFSLLKGKVRVKVSPSDSRSVRLIHGSTRFLITTGEYVVEEFDIFALTGSLEGAVRVYDPASGRYKRIPDKSITRVDQESGDLVSFEVSQSAMDQFVNETEPLGDVTAEVLGLSTQEERKTDPSVESQEPGEQDLDSMELEETVSKERIQPLNQETPDKSQEFKSTAETKLIQSEAGETSEGTAELELDQATQTETKSPQDTAESVETESQKEKETPVVSTTKDEKDDQPIVVVKKQEEVPESKIREKPALKEELIISEEALVEPEEASWLDFLIDKKWHISAISATLVSAWQASSSASAYNSLAITNENLKTQYAAATTSTARAAIAVEFENNKQTLITYKRSIDIFNLLSVAALGFEGYLLYKDIFKNKGDSESEKAQSGPSGFFPDVVRVSSGGLGTGAQVGLTAVWKW